MDVFPICVTVIVCLVFLFVVVGSMTCLITDYVPDYHSKILGTRDFKIVLRYADIDNYDFDDPHQVEKFRYYVEKIVDHITLNSLVKLYGTKHDLQDLVDSYFNNICVAFELYQNWRKKKISVVEYKRGISVVEKDNAAIVDKLKRFNAEVVEYTNYIYDDDGDDCSLNESRDAEYDLSDVKKCLK